MMPLVFVVVFNAFSIKCSYQTVANDVGAMVWKVMQRGSEFTQVHSNIGLAPNTGASILQTIPISKYAYY